MIYFSPPSHLVSTPHYQFLDFLNVGLSFFFSLKPQLPFMSAATVMSEVKVTLSGKGYYLCIDSQRDIALDEKKEIWKNLQNFPETQFMFLIVYPSF